MPIVRIMPRPGGLTRIDRTVSLDRLSSRFMLEWAQFEQALVVVGQGHAGDEIVRMGLP